MKKVFSLVLVGFLSLTLLTGCGCDKKEKENNNDVVTQPSIRDAKVKGLDVVDFIVTNENNISTIYYSVENNTDAAINFANIDCEMYDKDGNLIYSISKELGNIEPTEYKDFEINLSIDLSELASVKYNVE